MLHKSCATLAQRSRDWFFGARQPRNCFVSFLILSVLPISLCVFKARPVINVKLVENSGSVSDINFPGVKVSTQEIEKFEKQLFELADTHEYFVLAGSLPQGISVQMCASWIEKLNKLGKKVLFDSSREALSAGIKACPWLIKPNDDELSYLVNEPLTSLSMIQQAAIKVSEGVDNTVVSLGSEGVMWYCNGEWTKASPQQ